MPYQTNEAINTLLYFLSASNAPYHLHLRPLIQRNTVLFTHQVVDGQRATHILDVHSRMTVKDVKLAMENLIEIPVERQRLGIFRGQSLLNDKTLREYHISAFTTLLLCVELPAKPLQTTVSSEATMESSDDSERQTRNTRLRVILSCIEKDDDITHEVLLCNPAETLIDLFQSHGISFFDDHHVWIVDEGRSKKQQCTKVTAEQIHQRRVFDIHPMVRHGAAIRIVVENHQNSLSNSFFGETYILLFDNRAVTHHIVEEEVELMESERNRKNVFSLPLEICAFIESATINDKVLLLQSIPILRSFLCRVGLSRDRSRTLHDALASFGSAMKNAVHSKDDEFLHLLFQCVIQSTEHIVFDENGSEISRFVRFLCDLEIHDPTRGTQHMMDLNAFCANCNTPDILEILNVLLSYSDPMVVSRALRTFISFVMMKGDAPDKVGLILKKMDGQGHSLLLKYREQRRRDRIVFEGYLCRSYLPNDIVQVIYGYFDFYNEMEGEVLPRLITLFDVRNGHSFDVRHRALHAVQRITQYCYGETSTELIAENSILDQLKRVIVENEEDFIENAYWICCNLAVDNMDIVMDSNIVELMVLQFTTLMDTDPNRTFRAGDLSRGHVLHLSPTILRTLCFIISNVEDEERGNAIIKSPDFIKHLLSVMDRLLDKGWKLNINRRDWINQILDMWENDVFYESIKEELNEHRQQAVGLMKKIVNHVNEVETEHDFQQRIDEELRLRAASVLAAFFDVFEVV